MVKYYTSMKEIARDMRTIKRVIKPLANMAAVTAALSDDIKIRGPGSVTTPVKKPISDKKSKELGKNSAELDKLMDHQREVNNILNLLQNNFSNDEYPERDKMVIIAKRLLDNIGSKVATLKNQLLKTTQESAPTLLGQVANILKRNLDKELLPLSEKGVGNALTGMVDGQPQYTYYFIYTNVRDDKGEISPKVVFALSYYNESLFINPSLHDTVVPGKFNKGLPLNKAKGPNDIAKAALKEINHQLTADSMLSAVTGNPVPFTKAKLNSLKQESGIKMTFNTENDALLVTVSQPKANIDEIADKITVQLNSMILTDKSLPKMRIRYTKQQINKKWLITYKFIPSGKYNGKTLNQADVDHLRKGHFTDDQIHQMLISIKK